MTGMALFDVNGDVKPDLITSHDAPGAVVARLGLGGGIFGTPETSLVGTGAASAKSLAVAKLNNKPTGVDAFYPPHLASFAIVPTSSAINEFAVIAFAISVKGTFQAPKAYGSANGPYVIAAFGDLNSDGTPDVAAIEYEGLPGLETLLGDGKGGFVTPPFATANVPNTGPSKCALADFNGDGAVDIAISSFAEPTVCVAPGLGSGGFGPFTVYASNASSISLFNMEVGDLDLDGRVDLVYGTKSDVVYRLAKPQGLFGLETVGLSGAGHQQIALGDVDSDGVLDLAATASSTFVALGSTSQGTFSGFSNPTTIIPGGGHGVVIADLNGDSRPDVALVDANVSTLYTVLGDGSGGFGNLQTFPTGPNAWPSLCAADFDRDGYTDVVVFPTDDMTMRTRFSSSTGLTSKVEKDFVGNKGHYNNQGCVADLDQNGTPDVVVVAIVLVVFVNQSPGSPYAPWYGTKATTLGCQGLQSMNALGDVKIGNSNFQLHCSNAPPSSLGLAIVTTSALPNGFDVFGIGLNLLVDLIGGSPITFDVFSNASGEGYAAIPIPNNSQLVGFTAYAQTLWYWPSACNPSLLNLSSSSGVALSIHP
jgi:hypothetical protein